MLGLPESWGLPLAVGVATGLVLAFGVAGSLARRWMRGTATLANLLAALRAGDYSVRLARRPRGPLREVAEEFNRLAETLHHERLKAQEAVALLDDVLAGVDIAIVAFDAAGRIHLANAAAQRLAGQSERPLQGRTLEEVGLAALSPEVEGTLRATFPGGEGTFHVRSSPMRRDGRPLQFRIVSDIDKALRAKEEEAWRRLVRVMAHEINNSLAPIQSITDTVARAIAPPAGGDESLAEYAEALRAVGARASGLNRFLQPYSRLARLPEPQRRPVALTPLIARVLAVLGIDPQVDGEGNAWVQADPAQLEQVLVNLIRNAIEAGGPPASLALHVDGEGDAWRIAIRDRGIGLPDSDNLFVPFFTTKPEGSGIGLVLCRQIIEAHGGRLLLRSRQDGPGTEAIVTLMRATEEDN